MARTLLIIPLLMLLVISAQADMVRVTVSKVNIRLEPGSHHKILASVKMGDLLPVIDSSKEWWKVRLNSGIEGWVFKKAVNYEKEDYRNLIEVMTQEVLGNYMKWANLNEVYLEEYKTARLDVMVTPQWRRLDTEQQKNMMIHLAREFTQICEEDDVLKVQDNEPPYVAFFDRFNTLLGKANESSAVFAE